MVYFLVGPTASGKTKFSIKLAKKLNAEIISCDSMCVYKGMDILTSKPLASDRKKTRHHLIDIIPPAREFSVAEYRKMALEKIEEILRRKKIPLFVGGSGLYVKAVIDGLFPSAEKDLKFRNSQEALAGKYGKAYLYRKLKKIDPVRAKKIHPHDLRRVIRALEIYHTEKKRPSELNKTTEPLKYNFKIFGLQLDRQKLYKNIDTRAEEMFKKGIVSEVKKLSGKKPGMTAGKALGYNEVLGYLKGEYSLGQAKELLKKNTRHFAKKQLTWFHGDKRIRWIRG
ncbi:MAG: tRNA (adenosine(37)-N6)-dimethylallyltransferase MiaA [Candidatus Omnitrophica bacterium CG_4_9_14_0_2_um_filter_42_8]|nr:MAG: tRNA (adenosine(37)-N6)-dimethylallyltransferase MiaA [Candidatus Omnitrophica bacterium CG22_combo_CG10-13_8_21_14_all_43_16]PJC49008.1 MAG: tRNA (adenosine(37)-N6)-dimethylallyltransferase MiaA [Candidatus Omnitrophica bacterium CG_4_9_14_0_2_um_filter_42_8]